jgi:tRNA-dihydrouridine synthase 1
VPALDLAEDYLELCAEYPTPLGFIRTHCFKMLGEHLQAHPDMRQGFVQAKTRDKLLELTRSLRRAVEGATAVPAAQ